MASFNASASSSSSKPTRGCKHDVFLSFRGEDTRDNFVDHLYAALVLKGIQVFKDDVVIRKGKFISEELTHAIEESRFAVVVFSKNYADSSWCLGELVKIMKCRDQMGLIVLPVFYHVDPSDVRKQKQDYATAFQKHEDKISGEKNEVNEWREALRLASSLAGYPISVVSGGESLVISKIVQEIMGNMQPRGRVDGLIGIESHMDVLNQLLGMQKPEEVHIIGIHGMGGIGKTTIAQALYRRISFKYEGSGFIKNVREQSKSNICAIQEKILTDVLGAHFNLGIQDPEDGAYSIQERLCQKKVLLVLDDVDNVSQLDFLAASNNWFGAGSTIIITTRDEHVLSDANAKYKPALLRMHQAVELFSMHAFRKNSPPEEYKELSERAVRYTGGLPLALKVLGSFFRGRNARVWDSALDRLTKIPNREIFETLKLSYDDLNDFEQRMLLDIAYFFKDKQVKDVTTKLESFGFHAEIGISVLVEKSLIDVSKERIYMHDLIEEMCLRIVSESFTNSRLRNLEEVHGMVVKKEVHEVIEAIVVRKVSFKPKHGCFGSNVFKRMNNLRLLEVHDKFTYDEPSFLPKNLRWIRWKDYPFSSLPISQASKLVGLEIENSKIQHLWEGQKIMPNLKFIHLDNLNRPTRFPDVSVAPNIERLVLSDCHNLVEVHESIGFLKKLVYMEISRCTKLKLLPSRIEMESLDTLKLISCDSLERIPEFSPCVVKLSSLDLLNCSKILELPSSIRYLSNLSVLKLEYCWRLENIPSSICELKCLKHISLISCFKLHKLPDEFRSMINLEKLELRSTSFDNFRDFTNLCSLRKLNLHGIPIGEEDFPRNLDEFLLLEELLLARNSKLVRLPATISCLSNLKQLQLDCCHRIQSLHSLPLGLQVLSAVSCTSLEKIGDLSKEYEFLNNLRFDGCNKLLEDEKSRSYLENMLKQSFLKKWVGVDRCLSISIPGCKIPSWFKERQHGDQISLKLSPRWQTEILGFAICSVFKKNSMDICHDHGFYLTFENSRMVIHKLEADNITASAAAKNEIVLISYIPFTSFERMDDDNNCFQREGWFHMVEGNLVIKFSEEVSKCGVHVVYKEDVDSIQQIKPFVSSHYWNLTLDHVSANSILCSDLKLLSF